MSTLRVVCATAVPRSSEWFDSRGPQCCVHLSIGNSKYVTKVSEPSTAPNFDETFQFAEHGQEAMVEIQLLNNRCGKTIGGTEMKLKDLLRRPEWSLVIFDSKDRMVLDENGDACEIHFANEGDSVVEDSGPTKGHQDDDTTHAMIITRGTRGDVQPFIALARGLANYLGWVVTICTEMNCKSFIKDHADVQKGALRFAPSGGNTPKYINTALSRWAIRQKSEGMQAFMLSRSEMEFFDSAPAMIHWAKKLQPDVLIYGFTMPHIALMISELLKIPMIGFILQPAVIPSKELLAIEPMKESRFITVCYSTHEALAFRKKIQDYSPAHGDLNRLRASYGLPPLKGTSFELLQTYNMPLIVPINEFCFGRHPHDWSPNTVFTDFIFLRRPRLEVAPKPLLASPSTASLGTELASFIEEAKKAHAPVVLMAFSSMPVPRHDILEMAIKVIRQCPQKPRAIALVGQDIKAPLKHALAEEAAKLKEQNLLLEAAGAPFELVFPHMSCVIVHGGLGTTAEALRAGVPTIVTGVLLMDQRFWGKRVAELHVGPEPVFIDDFNSVCVQHVTRALSEPFVKRAKEVAQLAAGKRNLSEDGVEENVLMVEQMFRENPEPWKSPINSNSSHVCCIS
eukprot:GGOE01008296.1.p1 GENE.GGOE01008296.1~~GGOE01008296.1.p1  ORF type:complete len:640 (-),score=129.34 GGOE01008296.1:603-2477(-)